MDCLFFFTTESVCRYIKKSVECKICLSTFLSTSDVAKDTLLYHCGQMPNSFEKFINPHKELIHPNYRLYQFILQIESLFQKYCNFNNVFDLILDEITSLEIHVAFQCQKHKSEVANILAYIIKFYTQIRIREYLKREMANVKSTKSQLKKKQAKFYST